MAGQYSTVKKKKSVWSMGKPQNKKLEKFDFEKMKAAATHEDRAIRKIAFLEYFERFEEFPSFLFDNDNEIDERFRVTIKDIELDKETAKQVLQGILALRSRLSF
jgi:hypothetical protein